MKRKSNKLTLFFTLALALIIVLCISFCFKDKLDIGKLEFKLKSISTFTYQDLFKLSSQPVPYGAIKLKLSKQLSEPYVFNKDSILSSFAKAINKDKGFDRPFLRVAHWNIERGFNINTIKKIFSDKMDYFYLYRKNVEFSTHNKFKKELQDLMTSDVICLNEVDIGVPRTNYRNVVAELAKELNYNYAFATEFIELDPIFHRLKVNPKKYLGLHGNAILSKYPIKDAYIIRLPECYKWYHAEVGGISPLEHARRFGAKTVFKQEILTEVRHGNRCALICDIELPNGEIVTIVSTHLEDRCFPDKRFKQVEYLFEKLKNIRTPIVIAGDFNTTVTDSAPISVKKELSKRLRDPHFIARQAVLAIVPIGIPLPGIANLTSFAISKALQYKDPTYPSIPVLFPNQERKLFKFIQDFWFADGEMIDCDGDSKKSSNGKKGLLANSNERDIKGFESTFKFEEPRVIAYFKLDWFFVKPKGKRFKPFNGQTLQLVNHAYPGRVSDHEPITVDLNI